MASLWALNIKYGWRDLRSSSKFTDWQWERERKRGARGDGSKVRERSLHGVFPLHCCLSFCVASVWAVFLFFFFLIKYLDFFFMIWINRTCWQACLHSINVQNVLDTCMSPNWPCLCFIVNTSAISHLKSNKSRKNFPNRP